MQKKSKAAERAALDRMPPESPTFGRLTSGDLAKIAGHKGDFRFISARLDEHGDVRWLNFIGPVGQYQQCRSFAPERLKMPSRRKLNTQRVMPNMSIDKAAARA